MAYITDTKPNLGSTIWAAIRGTGVAVLDFLEDLTLAASRAETIEAMHEMDDATLRSRYNISRDQIVAYVFRDKLVP
ncbi:hypothetical protein [Neptunicoccus cionae]|uniref:Uncharacterized protein n=1 Tax=Neptunicoccus cionae TaxID=2035344 RepID=A0A916QQV5_9RHOB|nr:hypothetical protein [Amylibacter cionae]GGA06344.1 hypothetical protein GCM10011498_02530 [Amylibacter cionae]